MNYSTSIIIGYLLLAIKLLAIAVPALVAITQMQKAQLIDETSRKLTRQGKRVRTYILIGLFLSLLAEGIGDYLKRNSEAVAESKSRQTIGYLANVLKDAESLRESEVVIDSNQRLTLDSLRFLHTEDDTATMRTKVQLGLISTVLNGAERIANPIRSLGIDITLNFYPKNTLWLMTIIDSVNAYDRRNELRDNIFSAIDTNFNGVIGHLQEGPEAGWVLNLLPNNSHSSNFVSRELWSHFTGKRAGARFIKGTKTLFDVSAKVEFRTATIFKNDAAVLMHLSDFQYSFDQGKLIGLNDLNGSELLLFPLLDEPTLHVDSIGVEINWKTMAKHQLILQNRDFTHEPFNKDFEYLSSPTEGKMLIDTMPFLGTGDRAIMQAQATDSGWYQTQSPYFPKNVFKHKFGNSDFLLPIGVQQ